MKKQGILIIGILIILIFGNVLISAVCCEKLKEEGLWCASASTPTECDTNYHIWSDRQTCDSVVECEGTCVNENTGECGEYVAKTKCEESNGVWYEKELDEIPVCQMGCCIMGEDAYFINQVECKGLFTLHNVKGVFREDITSREGCAEMQTSVKTGACVISTPTEKACQITTNLDCTNDKINELSESLESSSSAQDISIKFYEGILCTASIGGSGISNCAKSENTECKNNKVYYKDTCGNFANVYDSSKYENPDYWTYIKDEYDSTETCVVGESGSSSCGNCEPTENTVCTNYQDSDLNKPSHNLGGLVCGDLSCKYRGVTYSHGESWCEGSLGTMTIHENLTTGEIFESNLTALENVNKYNLPGSRYYKLVCSYGEILVEECADYRNSVCVQGKDDTGNTYASCQFNPWRTCFELTTKSACEDSSGGVICKWVEGYRWDGLIVSETKRKEEQGSCVPLIAPGFDFWKGTSQGNSICAMGMVKDAALYETSWTNKRSNFAEWSDKTHAQQCVNGCYTIPGYASEFKQKTGEEKQYPEEINCETQTCTAYDKLTLYYDESEFKIGGVIKNYHLSTRQGQYCHKDGKEDHWLTGGINNGDCRSGSGATCYDCTPGAGSESKDERKERDYPIFLTNDEWINSITERARSLGDCGYKSNANGQYSAPESEIITAIFQKLKQNQEVKEDITVEQIIYKGGKYIEGDLENYETELPYEITEKSNCSSYGGMCMTTLNNPEPCVDGTINTEATCGLNSVCCIYDDLGAEDP